jgi:hypothetical protein
MRQPRKNIRRCCLLLAAVVAVALPGASWLSESNGTDRDTASWVSDAAPES